MRSSILFVSILVVFVLLTAIPVQAQINNADFENWTGDNPDSWTIVETGNNEVREDAFAYSGSASAELVCPSYSRPRLVQYINVEANEAVTANLFVYDNEASYTRLYLKVYDNDGLLLLQDYDQSANSGSWQALNVDLVTPASSAEIKFEVIYFYDTGTPGTQTNYIDFAEITISVPTFANIENPGLEDWTGGVPDSWTVIEPLNSDVQQETGTVYEGSYSASVTSTAYVRPRMVQFLGVYPGDTVTGRVQILDNDPSLPRLYLKAYDYDGTLIQQSFASATNNAAWQNVETTLVTPSTTAYVKFEIIQFYNTTSGGTQTIYVDAAEYEVDTYTFDVSTANQWYFIGPPVDITDQGDRNADQLFSDDLGGASTSSTWVMSRWNNTTQAYERFGNGDGDPLTEPPDIEPGIGYWFVQDVEPGVSDPWLDITSAQTSTGAPSSDVTQDIIGQTGGENGVTMLANPFYGDFTVSASVLTASGSPSDWGQDGINSNIYTWDGSQYLIQLAESATLGMWDGFWVVKTTTGDGDITFTYDSGDHGPVIDDYFVETGWGLQLCVESLDGTYLDTYNELGVRDRSLDGYDSYDAFEMTPPSSRYVSLAFTHENWDEGRRFAHDYRDKEFDRDSWNFEIKARRLPNSSFRLYWPALQGVPGNIEFELYRYNQQSIVRVGLLSELDDYVFTVGDEDVEVVRFRIIALDQDLVASVDEPGAELPVEFGIHSAYPNPFNAQISIKMGLPDAGNATMTVFDILGREVASLHNGHLNAGSHTFTWEAKDHASGIYFLRLSSGEQVSHRKVTLLQ